MLTGKEYPVSGAKISVTDEEYEDVYQEALLCLAENSNVGFPFQQPDGARRCEVDGLLLNDSQVIELWWGKEIAEKIRRERGEGGRRFKSQSGGRNL
jgi:hypothetical protein